VRFSRGGGCSQAAHPIERGTAVDNKRPRDPSGTRGLKVPGLPIQAMFCCIATNRAASTSVVGVEGAMQSAGGEGFPSRQQCS